MDGIKNAALQPAGPHFIRFIRKRAVTEYRGAAPTLRFSVCFHRRERLFSVAPPRVSCYNTPKQGEKLSDAERGMMTARNFPALLRGAFFIAQTDSFHRKG